MRLMFSSDLSLWLRFGPFPTTTFMLDPVHQQCEKSQSLSKLTADFRSEATPLANASAI